MKGENGFTLIELLGVIVVLAVIMVITIPVIDRSLNKGKKNLEVSQREQIIKALKDYYSDYNHSKEIKVPNCESEDDKLTCCKTISELKNSGNLPEDVKNPLTGDDYGSDDKACLEKSGEDTSVYESNVKYKYYIEINGNKYYE